MASRKARIWWRGSTKGHAVADAHLHVSADGSAREQRGMLGLGRPDLHIEERRRIMEHYGAEVVLVHDEGDIGACIQECIALAASMAAEDARVFVPQQFENRDNLAAHVQGTAAEILADVSLEAHSSKQNSPPQTGRRLQFKMAGCTRLELANIWFATR